MNMEPKIKHGALGGRLSRMDGPAKITGSATYAIEYQLENMAYGVTVQSTIAAGTIRHIDTKAAEASPGVLLVLTPDTIMPLKSATTWAGTPGPEGPFMALPKEVTFSVKVFVASPIALIAGLAFLAGGAPVLEWFRKQPKSGLERAIGGGVLLIALAAGFVGICGFALQEKTLGVQTPGDAGRAVQRRAQAIGALDDYPYLVEIATKLPESGYDNTVEFAWGLDLILDGLDRRRRTPRR